MMKQICVLFLALAAMTAKATVTKVINTANGQTVSEVLNEQWNLVDSVAITGPINSDDLVLLRKCITAGKLTGMDLSEATLENDSIPRKAFNHCTNLSYIRLPKNLRIVGYGAFMYCKYLQSVDFPATVTTIHDEAFDMCVSMKGTLKIPEGVKRVGSWAFANCYGISELVLSKELEEIGVCAFRGLRNVTQIELPEKLRVIGQQSFEGFGLTQMVVPESVEHIGAMAFRSTTLQSIKLPRGLKILEESVLAENPLTEIEWPEELEEIKGGALEGAELKQLVALPKKVRVIGGGAFCANANMEAVLLPASLESMATSAFEDCPRLKTVYCEAVVPPVVSGGYLNPEKYAEEQLQRSASTLYIPQGSKDAYATSPYWREFSQIIETDNFPTAIAATEYSPVSQQSSTWYRLDGSKGSPAHDYGRKSLRIADGRKVIK